MNSTTLYGLLLSAVAFVLLEMVCGYTRTEKKKFVLFKQSSSYGPIPGLSNYSFALETVKSAIDCSIRWALVSINFFWQIVEGLRLTDIVVGSLWVCCKQWIIIKCLHVKSSDGVLVFQSIFMSLVGPVVNWNSHLEPYNPDVRFAIKVLPLWIWWRFILTITFLAKCLLYWH